VAFAFAMMFSSLGLCARKTIIKIGSNKPGIRIRVSLF
jgi:hypothetical protein